MMAGWNNQKGTTWRLEYLDESVKMVTQRKKISPTGDYKYVPAAGLFANRPFRIISKLPSRRLMTVVGRNVVVKDRSQDMSQVWMYVEKNSCIKS
jgi:hypothetical protein